MKDIKISKDKSISGETLLDYLRKDGQSALASCGGNGICGKCKVKIKKGDFTLAIPYQKNDLITEREWALGYRLACKTIIQEDMLVQIQDIHTGKAKVLTNSSISSQIAPLVKKKYCRLEKPSLDDQRSDIDRIEGLFNKGNITISDIGLIRDLSYILKDNDYRVTLVYTKNEIIGIEAKDTSKDLYGLAIDIGTTTIAGVLIDLNTGKELAVYSSINPQKPYGDDVITRIDYTRKNPKGLKKLSLLLIDEINSMVNYFKDKCQISPDCIYHIAIVGNTSMMHMLVGVPVDTIATSPFNPVFSRLNPIEAADLGIMVNKKSLVTSLPLVSGYIGADTMGCIIASGMATSSDLSLLIDIGTNGEIVLGNRDKIVACSASAGPAFEGGNIEFGIGSISGAIDSVKLVGEDIKYSTIDNLPAKGICGSGIVDLIRSMLYLGIIEPNGRLIGQDEARSLASKDLAKRLVKYKDKDAFLVAKRADNANSDIYISQKDIRQVQLAKAAIRAGIELLLKDMQLAYDDISRVYLAGGFGNFIDIESAIAIGLLAHELRDKIKPIGNAALSGAKLTLMSGKYLDGTENLIELIHYIELSARADFQDYFIDHLEFKKEA